MVTLTVSTRRMSVQDIDRVVAIEKAIFSDPWFRDAFAREVSNRDGRPWVAVSEDGEILGYLIAWFVADEAHLGNIAVTPKARRMGIAQQLLKELVIAAEERGASHVFLEVRASNKAAQHLYSANGFQTISVRRGYYTGNQEDALVMRKSLDNLLPRDN